MVLGQTLCPAFPSSTLEPQLRDTGTAIPLRPDLGMRVVIAYRPEVPVEHSLVRSGTGEHLCLRELRVSSQRGYPVLGREDRVEVVEGRIGDELEPGVQERHTVCSWIGGDALMVQAGPAH